MAKSATASGSKTEILCIGPQGSGKTLLLKCLQYAAAHGEIWTIADIPSHYPTVGSSITELKSFNSLKGRNFDKQSTDEPGILGSFHKPKKSGANLFQKKSAKNVQIRELGGQLAPLWNDYYKEASGIIYVMDSADLLSVSSSMMHLIDCLAHSDLAGKPFLVVFSKRDIESPSTLMQYQNGIFFEDILDDEGKQHEITAVACSALTGVGIEGIISWLRNE